MLRATADKITKIIKKLKEVKENITKRGTLFTAKVTVLTVTAVTAAVFAAGNLNFGYKVICDGNIAGTAPSKTAAVESIAMAKEELESIPSATEAEEIKIVFTIAANSKIKDKEELKDLVVACYDGKTACYGIFADGSLVVDMATKEEAKAALDAYKAIYKADNASAYFSKKVEILPSRALKEDFADKSKALSAFRAESKTTEIYTVKKDGTVADVASALKNAEDTIRNLNPSIKTDKVKKGDKIKYEKTAPVIAVVTSFEVTNKETVAFTTEKTEDKEAYEGTSTVLVAGITGEKEVQYRITEENGVETSRTALSEKITKEPVSEQLKVGTKPRPKTETTGTFMTPYHGILTSRYGSYRSRGTPHTGVDLAGPTGSEIYAADGGVVTNACYKGSYGNLVVIKHDNGYETYYAHLNGFNVSNGQRVSKGQLIGFLGNTGNSSGPHLHFEVRLNGKNVNPSQFISID